MTLNHHKLQEYFMVIPITMYFPKNSYLVEPFDTLLLQFQQAGLLNFWTSINEDKKFLEINADTREPRKLTLEHLSGPFQIWLVGCFISVTAFFMEMFWFKIKAAGCVTAAKRMLSMGKLNA
jgi:hypothetical protein